MLPDKAIKCHRTGFQMSCFEGVTEHRCRLWCHVSGTDHMARELDVYGCTDELHIKLLHEIAKEVRQAAASTDKVATEVKAASEAACYQSGLMINGMRASLPMLTLVTRAQDEMRQLEDHAHDQREREWVHQAGHRHGEGAGGHADAARVGDLEHPHPGDDHLPAEGPLRGDVA